MLIRVQNWWNGNCFAGSPSFILAQKLKAFKAVLKMWNREEFGDLAFRKKNLLTELMGLDAREELLLQCDSRCSEFFVPFKGCLENESS